LLIYHGIKYQFKLVVLMPKKNNEISKLDIIRLRSETCLNQTLNKPESCINQTWQGAWLIARKRHQWIDKFRSTTVTLNVSVTVIWNLGDSWVDWYRS
jgi:hypothetical protein